MQSARFQQHLQSMPDKDRTFLYDCPRLPDAMNTLQTEQAEPGSPQPDPPLPMFFRLSPLLLIPGSLTVVAGSLVLASTLRWSDPIEGLPVAAVMTFLFGIPLYILLTIVQSVLGLIFMSRRRRAGWRTCMVLLPAALLVGLALYEIVQLYPPERRARRDLAGHLDGPLPPSIDNLELYYRGGIDPDWTFTFTIAPDDYKTIKAYRTYEPSPGATIPSGPGTVTLSPTALQAHETGYFYYLDYDLGTRRCTFQAMNY